MKNNYKIWIIVSFIIVFIVGAVAGALLDRYVIPEKEKKIRKERRPSHFPTLDNMAEELKLTSEQEENIREIFRNNEKKIKDLRTLIHERLSSIRSQLKEEIENVLTEEQKTKFEAMIERHLRKRREKEKRNNQKRR